MIAESMRTLTREEEAIAQDLVERSVLDDKAINAFRPTLVTSLIRRFSISKDDAEDAYSAAVVAVVDKYPHLRGVDLEKMLALISRHAVMDIFREKRLVVDRSEGAAEALMDFPDDSTRDEASFSVEVLASLSEEDKQMFGLLVEGYTVREIASFLSMSSSSVDRDIQRIKKVVTALVYGEE